MQKSIRNITGVFNPCNACFNWTDHCRIHPTTLEKSRSLKALLTINPDILSNIGNVVAGMNEVCNSPTVFLISCLGKAYAGCKSMTQCRIKMWKKKTGAGTSMKLCNLPPTSEATVENIKRAHYQGALWLNSMSGILSPSRPTDFGWEQDGLALKPRTITQGTTMAPEDILDNGEVRM